MTPFFSAEGGQALRAAARARALLVLDFDGTLAPIVDDPAAACVRDRTRELLRVIALRVPCAVVSGRARGDVAARVTGVPLRAIVGNLGAEPARMGAPEAVRARVRAWAAALRGGLAQHGVEIADQGFSVAVHLRQARDPAAVRACVARLAGALPGARVIDGSAMMNVVPETAPTKGDAVEAFAAEFPGARVLYVGDDDTDEDAFRTPAVSWGVRVGRVEPSAARFFLEDQAQVDRLLEALLRAHGG